MDRARSFLGKFKQIFTARAATRQLLSEAIEQSVGARVDPEQIEVKDRIAVVRGPASLKSEIHIRQDDILSSFRGKGGSASIEKIL